MMLRAFQDRLAALILCFGGSIPNAESNDLLTGVVAALGTFTDWLSRIAAAG